MTERMYEVTMERTFAAPALSVWGLISDTNRWDRASGLTPGRYQWRDVDGQRLRIGTARELGFDIEWIEPPYEWVEGQLVHGERRFLKGPVARGGFRAHVQTQGEQSTTVIAVAYVAGDGPLMPVLGRVMQKKFRGALTRYLDGLGEVLSASASAGRLSGTTMERVSGAWLARELIGEQPYDGLTQGPRSPTSLPELSRRITRLRAHAELAAPLIERLTQTLTERPDEEVAQLRPFELADRWHVDRRALLKVFLHATRVGVVDLRWQINCPVCRVAAQVVGTLADVTGQVHCAACNIGYDVDFGSHVEAVFQCHPAIRSVDTSVYCASSPSFLPHVVAQLAVAPLATRHEPLSSDVRDVRVRLLYGTHHADAALDATHSLRITLREEGIAIETQSSNATREITIVSGVDRAQVVLVERADDTGDAVLGSVIASFPDFLDLFATEAPATGVELSVAHLALLFSDLTGSTALYQQVGDARAFAIVQEHFRDMTATVVEHGGAIVKTMGDAVMATFTSEQDAIRSAIAMVQRCHDHHDALGLGAKLGVYAGPCLAVRANDRLDFFGTTVNLAARLQAQAERGQLVLTADQARTPDVHALIAPYPKSPFRAHLKGITEEQELIAVQVAPMHA